MSAFYLILNVAVGGQNGYFPDNLGNKPWNDGADSAMSGEYSVIKPDGKRKRLKLIIRLLGSKRQVASHLADRPHKARHGRQVRQDVAEVLSGR